MNQDDARFTLSRYSRLRERCIYTRTVLFESGMRAMHAASMRHAIGDVSYPWPGYRVSLPPARLSPVKLGGSSRYKTWAARRYECVEFINGRRANDKSRVRYLYVSRRFSFLFAREGRKRERERTREGREETRAASEGGWECLPSTKVSYRAHRDAARADKSVFVFTLRPSCTLPRTAGGVRDRVYTLLSSSPCVFTS